MFRSFPIFMYTQGYGQHHPRHGTSGLWWLTMVPGLVLIGMALAMIVWPALLAYLVASIFLCVGLMLAASGWRLRSLTQQTPQRMHQVFPMDDFERDR